MAKFSAERDQSSDIANYIGGGLRYKEFSKKIEQAFTANNSYTFSPSDLGLNPIIPKGFAIAVIGGSQSNDYSGTLRASGGNIVYKCMANNATDCTFRGIVFY